jgi:N-methylhydantoinase B
LAIALPDRVPAASNGSNTTAVFSGIDPRNGAEYLYLETYGGGGGGRPNKDGKDGVQQHIANTANLPVEAIETEYPLRVEEYSLAADSGGAGKFRGGLALKRVIRPVGHTCLFTGAGERFRTPPWGLKGGLPGLTGGFSIMLADGTVRDLPNKPHPMQVSMDECLVIRSPGAGGYGLPSDRSPSALAVDLVSGKYSAEFASSQYGVDPNALLKAYDADWVMSRGVV